MIYTNIEYFSINSSVMQKNQSLKPDSPVGFTVEGVLGLAGGRGAVARECGVSVQTVAKWGRRIPSSHARKVAILAGLPLAVVRPDMVQHKE